MGTWAYPVNEDKGTGFPCATILRSKLGLSEETDLRRGCFALGSTWILQMNRWLSERSPLGRGGVQRRGSPWTPTPNQSASTLPREGIWNAWSAALNHRCHAVLWEKALMGMQNSSTTISGTQWFSPCLRRFLTLAPTLRATVVGPDEFPQYQRLPLRSSDLSLPCVLWILSAELLSVARSASKFLPSRVPRFWILSFRVAHPQESWVVLCWETRSDWDTTFG